MVYYFFVFQSAFLKYVPGSSGVRSSSFNLRLILWEAGITVSNKVLECLILRFAKNKLLSSEAYVIVMIRLHLAHGKLVTSFNMIWQVLTWINEFFSIFVSERYHSIDTKMKGNPLSLEEMILMTIYSWLKKLVDCYNYRCKFCFPCYTNLLILKVWINNIQWTLITLNRFHSLKYQRHM